MEQGFRVCGQDHLSVSFINRVFNLVTSRFFLLSGKSFPPMCCKIITTGVFSAVGGDGLSVGLVLVVPGGE